ncbi:MAG: 30s ribosomal protein S12 methylthiotransferase accessory protein YcaO [Gammaproteobacteria bacterium]|nr:MAG: 30s ribosomal protein S12 methylthiotransferase accessory protein YcaO [Gammaproteobacteria bacterium]
MSTLLPGKDAPLEATIERLQARLDALGFHVEPASWLNPVPNVWSVHIRDRDCPQLFTNGKGRSREAALASALGEFFERLSTNYFWADFHLPDFRTRTFVHFADEVWLPHGDQRIADDLPLRAFYDREGALSEADLTDLTSGHAERGVCCLPFRRLDQERTVLLPVNLLENLYASNGMSAGNTPAEARVQTLSEIFERAIRIRVLREGLSLPDIPEAVIDRWPRIREAVDAIRERGFVLLLRDASLGGRYPVINVTLINPEDGSCFASWGAHPLFEVALERTVTELLQGRALEDMRGFSTPSTDLEEVASLENLETHFIDASGLVHWGLLGDAPDFPFHDWNWAGSTEEQYRQLLELFARDGLAVYCRDYTEMGVYACRIIVPGLSEIYPPEDLLEANNNAALPVLDCLHALPEPTEEQVQCLAEWLDTCALDDYTPCYELAGLRPAPDDHWGHLRIGELRLWTALQLGEQETARDQAAWLRDLDVLPEPQRRLIAAVHDLLDLELSGYAHEPFARALAALHGTERYQQASRLVRGEAGWPGLGPAMDGPAHQALQLAYEKAWQARATARQTDKVAQDHCPGTASRA